MHADVISFVLWTKIDENNQKTTKTHQTLWKQQQKKQQNKKKMKQNIVKHCYYYC